MNKAKLLLRPLVSLIGSLLLNILVIRWEDLQGIFHRTFKICHTPSVCFEVSTLFPMIWRVSFDVTSLSSHIPDSVVFIQDLPKQIENSKTWQLSLTNVSLRPIVSFRVIITKNLCHFYGFKVSLVVANIFMETFEELALQFLGCFQYIHDTFIDFLFSIDTFHMFLEQLNSKYIEIEFIMEIEFNRSFPFFDVLKFRLPNGHLGYSLYRKSSLRMDIFIHMTITLLFKNFYSSSKSTSLATSHIERIPERMEKIPLHNDHKSAFKSLTKISDFRRIDWILCCPKWFRVFLVCVL